MAQYTVCMCVCACVYMCVCAMCVCERDREWEAKRGGCRQTYTETEKVIGVWQRQAQILIQSDSNNKGCSYIITVKKWHEDSVQQEYTCGSNYDQWELKS